MSESIEWTEQQVKVSMGDNGCTIMTCYDMEFMKRLAAFFETADTISGPAGISSDDAGKGYEWPAIALYGPVEEAAIKLHEMEGG